MFYPQPQPPEIMPSPLTTPSRKFSVPEVRDRDWYGPSSGPAQGPAEKRSAPLAVTRRRLKILCCLLFLLTARAAGDRPEATPGIGSRYPNLHPTEKGLLMTWFEPSEGGFTLQWSELNGATWSTPGAIVESNDFFVNWADFPSIYQLGDNTLVVHWLQKSGSGTFDYDVKVVWSTDRGRTWSKPVMPHRDGGPGEHGFVSFFPRSEGDLGLVWLDGRNMTPEGDDYGEMSLYATSIEGDGSLGPEEVLDARVCECCPTAAVAGA